MTDRYLFRLDGSRENDEFFSLYSSPSCRATYSGTPMKIGPGWIPDFLEVKVSNGGLDFKVILIELEATQTTALESARKYLPENPISAVEAFKTYLNAIIGQCRVTADPRIKDLKHLLGLVSAAPRIQIFTAAGLRDSKEFVEVLPLIHQAASSSLHPAASRIPTAERFEAKGQRVLSRREAEGLQRTVRILDAVVTGRDDSGGNFHSWQNVREKPLHQYAAEQSSTAPELNRLLHRPRNRGLRVDLDKLLEELLAVWSRSNHLQTSKQQIAVSIEEYLPIAHRFRAHTPMRVIFQEARQILAKNSG